VTTAVRTPPTAAVAAARDYASQVRLALACFGIMLLVVAPQTHPVPQAAAAGFAILLGTGLLHRRRIGSTGLRVEEPFALLAGVFIVTLGPPGIGPLTLLWIVSAALGVVGRGGRASATGRLIVVGVLASPMARHGVDADTATILFAGCGLLLSVGTVSNETHELLRDPLTGALSRAALLAEAERMVARAREHEPVALILIDLDDFGKLNKREGHEAGDVVLQDVATAVTGTLRRADTFGRLGGDEFLVLAVGDGARVAQRALDAIATTGISGSAGVATAPQDGMTVPELRRRADVALRASKTAGKTRATVFAGPPASSDPPGRRSAATR
jgi:diguanylate cyclase (GGDEF)-like protein